MQHSERRNKKGRVGRLSLVIAACVMGLTGQALADEAALEERVEILTQELLEIKEQMAEEKEQKLTFHGYAELHYNGTDRDGEANEIDFHRLAFGLEYRFTDRIVFDFELDFEHAGEEIELEYAHVSFLLSKPANVRIGSMLMPVGYLNEFHEPLFFYSVERPYVQRYVIPTTWQEGGVGLFGSPIPSLNYRLYLVGGLDASEFTGSSGIRDGRGRVGEALAEDVAGVGRISYAGIPGLRLGVSGYIGGASQGDPDLDGVKVGIVEGDVRYRWKQFELTGLVASIFIDDTEKIFQKTDEVVGENILGWYLEGACHVGTWFLPREMDLVLFGRHERFDTQNKVADGLEADPANDRRVTTFGLAYYPIRHVVLKADVESWENGADEDWLQYNAGIGLMW